MSLVSSTIPNLVNGVSQQPYAMRLASQAEEQVNAYSSVVEGLRKRPPTKFIAKLLNTPLPNAKVHIINRDQNERYAVIATNGDLRVFRFDGTEVPVNFPNGKAYLTSTAPEQDIQVVTVADYTFFLNKTVVVKQNDADAAPTRPFEVLVWVRQGNYKNPYKVSINGTSATYTTRSSWSTTENETNAALNSIQTANIAEQLRTLLVSGTSETGYGGIGSITGGTLGPSFTVTRYGSVLHISSPTDFTVATSDGQGDTAMSFVKNSVQSFEKLPSKGVTGFQVRVVGTKDNAFDDYFVSYQDDATNPNSGVWKESAKAGEVRSLLATTMPHSLVREANGTFTFKANTWDARKAGDLKSCPMPSCVGRTINDVFFHKNRLGFLSDENVILSGSGSFFNLFRTSVLQTIDTDPIDVAASHVKVSILRHAIPFNETLLLFSDQTQFTLGQQQLLTPKTVSISLSTEFDCSLRAKPVGAGPNVYFTVDRGQYTGIREFFVDSDTKANNATDVTSHCPRYLPKGVVKLAGSSNEDAIVALSENARGTLYVYRYFWQSGQKLQSSWSRWEFGTDDRILSVDFIASELWMVVSRPNGTFLEKVSLEPGARDEPAQFEVHLDRKVYDSQTTQSYDAATNTTTITLPYPRLNSETYRLVSWFGDEGGVPGRLIDWTPATSSTDNAIKVPGKLTKFVWGRSYTMRYRFSTLMVREDAGGGKQPVGAGRLQVKRVGLTFNNAGYFTVEVTPAYRDTYRYVYSGRVLGAGQNVLGKIALDEGTYRFPVGAKNEEVTIDIVNDSHLPCAFLSAEWEGYFQMRSARI
ncbi:phage nozzle protein [Labrys neptuniae]